MAEEMASSGPSTFSDWLQVGTARLQHGYETTIGTQLILVFFFAVGRRLLPIVIWQQWISFVLQCSLSMKKTHRLGSPELPRLFHTISASMFGSFAAGPKLSRSKPTKATGATCKWRPWAKTCRISLKSSLGSSFQVVGPSSSSWEIKKYQKAGTPRYFRGSGTPFLT